MSDVSHRPIRSFVLRQGRLSNAQARALEQLMPRWGLAFAASAQGVPFDQVFGRTAPTILEIGFGMGETTFVIAQQMPEKNFLAIDVHTPGIGNLLKIIDESAVTNIRVMNHDAVEVLREMIANESLDGAHIFFADPWPKARHHKRRLIQPDFVRLLASRLKSGARIHLATDWKDYAQHMLQVLSTEPQLCNTAADYAARPDYRPLTKFERRGLKLGHGVWDLVFEKR